MYKKGLFTLLASCILSNVAFSISPADEGERVEPLTPISQGTKRTNNGEHGDTPAAKDHTVAIPVPPMLSQEQRNWETLIGFPSEMIFAVLEKMSPSEVITFRALALKAGNDRLRDCTSDPSLWAILKPKVNVRQSWVGGPDGAHFDTIKLNIIMFNIMEAMLTFRRQLADPTLSEEDRLIKAQRLVRAAARLKKMTHTYPELDLLHTCTEYAYACLVRPSPTYAIPPEFLMLCGLKGVNPAERDLMCILQAIQEKDCKFYVDETDKSVYKQFLLERKIRAALARDPNNTDLHDQLLKHGVSLLIEDIRRARSAHTSGHNYDRAFALREQLLAHAEVTREDVIEAAEAYHNAGQFLRAAELIDRVFDREDSSIEDLRKANMYYYRAQNHDRATELSERILAHPEHTLKDVIDAAIDYYNAKNYDRCFELYEQVLASEECDIDFVKKAANAYFNARNVKPEYSARACELYDRYFAHYENLLLSEVWRYQPLAEEYFNAKRIHHKYLKRALELYDGLTTEDEEILIESFTKAVEAYYKAWKFYRNDEEHAPRYLQRALELYERLITLPEADEYEHKVAADAYYEVWKFYRNGGERAPEYLERALALYEKALTFADDDDEFFQRNNPDAPIDYLKEAAKAYYEAWKFHRDGGELAPAYLGRALELHEKALDYANSDDLAYLDSGVRIGHLREAAEAYRAAGSYYRSKGDEAAQVKFFSRAAELSDRLLTHEGYTKEDIQKAIEANESSGNEARAAELRLMLASKGRGPSEE